MAIDDNTVYGLTGAQVKELPERINAVKGLARVLTTDDYNWPTTGTKTSVALWLLDPGIYCGPEDGTAVSVKLNSTTSDSMGDGYSNIAIVLKNVNDSSQRGQVLFIDGSSGRLTQYYSITASGSSSTRIYLRTSDIVDNLTSTSTNAALSANQGKVLKDLIDNIAVPTVNDATLTIQANGTTVNTFTANASSNVTANIPSATTGRYGVTQLSDSISSTSTALAATSSAVKSAYDLAGTKAKITMSSTDPGEGVALAENEYIAVYGGDTMNLDYSTTEKATGGTWIDGSAIYKKTVNFGALPNNADKTVAHGISNLGRVIRLEGMAYDSSTSTYAPLPYASDSTSAIDVSIVGSNIRVHTFSDRTALSDAYITIYYTKSS